MGDEYRLYFIAGLNKLLQFCSPERKSSCITNLDTFLATEMKQNGEKAKGEILRQFAKGYSDLIQIPRLSGKRKNRELYLNTIQLFLERDYFVDFLDDKDKYF